MYAVFGIIEEEDKFLMIQDPRQPFVGKWRVTGGRKKDPEETDQHCLQRKIRNDFSVEVEVGRLLGEVPSDAPELDFLRFYQVTILDKNLRPNPNEVLNIQYIKRNKVLDLDLILGTRTFFQSYFL